MAEKGEISPRETSKEGREIKSSEGLIPCIIVFPDRKHVGYINNIVDDSVDALKECLYDRFKVYKLSGETRADEHFGKTFEKLADECYLGIVLLDGFRPNVLFEYGILRGKGKVLIPVQDKKAYVAVDSFYSTSGDSDNAYKESTGLEKEQFETLKKPPLGHFDHLSDCKGIKIVEVDHNAPSDSPDHPKNMIKEELEKLMPEISERYSKSLNESLKLTGTSMSEEHLKRFHDLSLRVSEYYTARKQFDSEDVESAAQEIKELEKSSNIRAPSRMYGTLAVLYVALAERTEWKKVDEIAGYYQKAADIYEQILTPEGDAT